MTIFHHLQFRATLTTILHTSQNPHVLHISGLPKIDTARRRERTSEMDLAKTPFRAGEMQIFDLEGNFSPRGSPKKPDPSAHTTDLHQMLFTYRKNPIVWPHCLGKNLRKHQVLETFWEATWTQHESNMHKNLRKHQVLETFWEATWTQHESNMHKNLRKHQVF